VDVVNRRSNCGDQNGYDILEYDAFKLIIYVTCTSMHPVHALRRDNIVTKSMAS